MALPGFFISADESTSGREGFSDRVRLALVASRLPRGRLALSCSTVTCIATASFSMYFSWSKKFSVPAMRGNTASLSCVLPWPVFTSNLRATVGIKKSMRGRAFSMMSSQALASCRMSSSGSRPSGKDAIFRMMGSRWYRTPAGVLLPADLRPITRHEDSRLRSVASWPATSGSNARTKLFARGRSCPTWSSVSAVPIEATTLVYPCWWAAMTSM